MRNAQLSEFLHQNKVQTISTQSNFPTQSSHPTHVSYFENLRAIAIVAVVVLHSAAWNWYLLPVTSLNWQLLNVIDSVVRFCVPIFFMVSGALFLDPQRNVTIRSIFTKSLPRIIIPFFFWSILYAAATTFGPTGDNVWGNFFARVFLGHYHLWFLIALGGLYLAAPLLRPLVERRGLAWYFVALAGAFTTLLPLIELVPRYGHLFTEFLGTMKLHLVLGYSVYFVLGYLLHTIRLTRRLALVAGFVGVLGIVGTALGTSMLSVWAGAPEIVLYGYLTPNVVLASAAVFVCVRYFMETGARGNQSMVIKSIAAYSFGIYLVHPAFQSLYQSFGFTSDFANPLISIPLLTIAILIPSWMLAIAIHHIPKVGKYLA